MAFFRKKYVESWFLCVSFVFFGRGSKGYVMFIICEYHRMGSCYFRVLCDSMRFEITRFTFASESEMS